MKTFQMPADVVLEGAGGTFCFFQPTWELALRLARHYGWEPAAPSDVHPIGIGALISAADASALAKALEAAIHDMGVNEGLDGMGIRGCQEQWEDLVRFCRAGAFRILNGST